MTGAGAGATPVDLGAEPLLAPVISPDSPPQDGVAGSFWYHHMFADISGIGGDGSPVYIKFVCTDESIRSSDWEPILTVGSFGSGDWGTITFANDRIDYDVQVGWGAAFGYGGPSSIQYFSPVAF